MIVTARSVAICLVASTIGHVRADESTLPLTSVRSLGEIADSATVVWLKGPEIDNSSLKHLRELRSLTSLALDHVGVDDEGLEALIACSKLQRLAISYSKITDEGVTALARIPSLKMLFLFGCDIGEHGVRRLQELRTDLEVSRHPGAFLGVSLNKKGQVGTVMEPAKSGGIRIGDVLTHFDGRGVDVSSLIELVRAARTGQEVTLGLRRGGERMSLGVVLGEWPMKELVNQW